jgi:PAS domain S-box-containing protein
MNKDVRLLAVKRFQKFDFKSDVELNEIIEMASGICKTPVALITLVDKDTQWLKVRKGTDVERMPREISFCSKAIEQDDLLLIPDASADDRFSNNPIVTGAPKIRFYAGAPLITHDGYKLGTLCVIDTEPHELTDNQQKMIKMLSKQAINIMELRVSSELLESSRKEIHKQNQVIKDAQTRLRSFFESSTNFHVLLGKKGEVIDFNKTAFNFIERIHGKKLLPGNDFIGFLAVDFKDIFVEKYIKALTGENCYEEGFTDYGAHGIIWWEASFETARDANNKIIGISYLIRNVTERKLKEQKIIDQNTSLLTIAHIHAHEFRAPLTSIMGLMTLIKEDDYKAPKEYFNLLDKAVLSLDEIIQRIISNIENSKYDQNGTGF